jgi:L-ascorbate metabolism protein UlaG (beta-lactamase superfamily)
MKKLVLSLAAAASALLAGCATNTNMVLGAAPMAMAANAPRTVGKTEVLWLGQSSLRVTTPGGKVIMIDPWLQSNPKTPAEWKKLEALGKIDLILVTHAHFDHFADAVPLAKMHNAPLYGPAGLGQVLATYGALPAELAPRFGKGGTILPFGPAGVKITATHAEHSSELAWKDAAGKDIVLPGGEPVGFVIEMENGFKLYHMGDTGIFGDMKLIGDLYKPDVVTIPIGNHFVMSPQDAAVAARDLVRAKWAFPVHYGTTPQLRGTPAEFKAALGAAGNMMLVVDPGQKVEF